jgi:anti-anti-sigma factor
MSTANTTSQFERGATPRRDAVGELKARAIWIEFCPPCIALIKLRGEHDLTSKRALTEALATASAQLNILVDLSECTFIDSTVIAALFRASESLRPRNGRLELLVPQSSTTIRHLAKITALDKLLPIHETRSAAIASFQRFKAQTLQTRVPVVCRKQLPIP